MSVSAPVSPFFSDALLLCNPLSEVIWEEEEGEREQSSSRSVALSGECAKTSGRMCCRRHDGSQSESLNKVHTCGPNTAGSLQTERQTWTLEKSVFIVRVLAFVPYDEANLVGDYKTRQIKRPTLRLPKGFQNRCFKWELWPNSCSCDGI